MKLRDPIFLGQKIPKLKSLGEIPKNETETVGLDGLKKKRVFGLPRFLPRASSLLLGVFMDEFGWVTSSDGSRVRCFGLAVVVHFSPPF